MSYNLYVSDTADGYFSLVKENINTFPYPINQDAGIQFFALSFVDSRGESELTLPVRQIILGMSIKPFLTINKDSVFINMPILDNSSEIVLKEYQNSVWTTVYSGTDLVYRVPTFIGVKHWRTYCTAENAVSDDSPALAYTAPILDPITLSVRQISANIVQLDWTDNGSNVYVIYKDGIAIDTVEGTTTYQLDDLTFIQAIFQIEGVKEVTRILSNVVIFEKVGMPDKVISFTITSNIISVDRTILNVLIDPVDSADGYLLFQFINDQWVLLTDITSLDFSIEIDNKDMILGVSAYNISGNGEISDPINVYFIDVPDAPTIEFNDTTTTVMFTRPIGAVQHVLEKSVNGVDWVEVYRGIGNTSDFIDWGKGMFYLRSYGVNTNTIGLVSEVLFSTGQPMIVTDISAVGNTVTIIWR